MVDIVQRLVVLGKAVSVKVWNGLAVVGNPCAVVDVQIISKQAAASNKAESERESSSALAFDNDEKEEADAEPLEERMEYGRRRRRRRRQGM
jgi:hypothetical protein